MNCSTKAGQRSQNIRIDLPRVSLPSDRVSIRQTRQLGDPLVQRLDLVVIPIKEGQETPLRSGSSLDASETDVIPSPLEIPEIPKKFLDPQSGSLSDGGELSRLEVGEPEGGEVTVGLGELGETGDDDGQLGKEDVESVSEEDQVGVAVLRCRREGKSAPRS